MINTNDYKTKAELEAAMENEKNLAELELLKKEIIALYSTIADNATKLRYLERTKAELQACIARYYANHPDILNGHQHGKSINSVVFDDL